MAAFPVVQSTSSGNNNTTTSHTVTLPTGITAGDKLLVFFTTEGGSTGTTNTPSGWTKEAERVEDSGADVIRLVVYSKTAVGSDTLTVTTNDAVDSAYTCYRVYTAGDIELATLVDGNDANPNSPSLTPSFGSGKHMWVSAVCFSGTTVSSYPTNYTSNQLTNTAESFDIASAVYFTETATEDPATYTIGASSRWVAATVAVEAQPALNVTSPLVTSSAQIFTGAIDYASNASSVLLEPDSQVFTGSSTAFERTRWTTTPKS